MNPRLQRYLADLRDRLPRDVASQARVAEAQLHLEQAAADRQAVDPALGEDEALRQAIEAFGASEDFVPGAPARRWRRTQTIVASRTGRFALAATLLALVAGASAGAILETHEDPDLFHHREALSLYTGPLNESFEVPAGINALRFSFQADHEHDGAPACANVTVTNPAGRIALLAGSTCSHIDADLPSVPGTWTVRFDLQDFTGTLETELRAETNP